MDFRIADTFTDSLARLTGAEQKAVKTTAFDLQVDPTAPGLPRQTPLTADDIIDPNFLGGLSSALRISGCVTECFSESLQQSEWNFHVVWALPRQR